MAKKRYDGNVIPWTNDSGDDISKAALVHLGGNKFGVAVDAIDSGDEGRVIVKGYFSEASAILNESVGAGTSLESTTNSASGTVTNLQSVATPAESAAITMSNLYLAEDVTASAEAQDLDVILI